MACPYFEPQHIVLPATHAHARLPLIEEYDGLCRATDQPLAPESGHRFRFCNHGNAQGKCAHFPLTDVPTSLRYSVAARDPLQLEVLIVEEKKYWPASWQRVRFQIATECLDPDNLNAVGRAQLLAFCRSYLKKFVA